MWVMVYSSVYVVLKFECMFKGYGYLYLFCRISYLNEYLVAVCDHSSSFLACFLYTCSLKSC